MPNLSAAIAAMDKACRHCMHRETTRECPACHEEHVPVASAKGPVCPSCGHRYNG